MLTLTFVIILPIAIFTGIEISTLNENEEVLDNVYRKQLDGLIFSVNQYSADLFNYYVRQIDFEGRQLTKNSYVDSAFLQQNLAIEGIAIEKEGKMIFSDLGRSNNISFSTERLNTLISSNNSLIERLKRYQEAGYQKPESIGQVEVNGTLMSMSLIIVDEGRPSILFFNPVHFIEDLLAPKIQEIADQNLDVSVKHLPSNTFVYSQREEDDRTTQRSVFPLFPNYEIAVTLKGESIQSLIAYRTNRSIISLVALVFLIILGTVLVIRNLRKEMLLSKAKADFVANVSHEIRTPLALISMFNETLLLDRVGSEKKKHEYYEIISKETSRLRNIINKILSFSQIDADKKSYKFDLLDPKKEIEEVLNSYSYHLQEKGFSYELELDPSETILKADKEAFVEVIINLIDNAIKYSKEEKYLSIKSYQKQKKYIIEVSDKGIGIERGKQQQVFEKFYRVTGGNIHETKGTGLGLSLVASIMQAHGGKVELDSKLGQGSTFRLYFEI